MSIARGIGGGIASGTQTAGNMWDSFIHPEKAYQKASEASQKYYVDAQGRLQPLVNQGQDQYGRLNGQADALGNPAQLENQWASSYNESPYAKSLGEQSNNSGLDAASSMGLLGSSPAISAIQSGNTNIMQKDRQNYMDDLMKKYMASIGIGENLYGVGAAASGQQSSNAMAEGGTQAGLAYGEQAAPGALFGNLLNKAVNYSTGVVNQ